MNITITLIHAKWCHNCTAMMGEWELLKEKIKNNMFGNIGNVSHDEIEHSEITNGTRAEDALINGDEIKGFPTIKITIYNDKKSKDIEYEGKRHHKEIISFVKYLFEKINYKLNN